MLSADLVLSRLGHLELRQKQAGDVLHAEGIRLAIVEIMRMVAESKPKLAGAVDLKFSALQVRSM